MSGFTLESSTPSTTAEAYWPPSAEIDFLRAIRTYQQRARRFGR